MPDDAEVTEIRVVEGYAIPGPEVSCMDAAEMLVDGFIKDAQLWPDPQDRNELVRRTGTLLSMQRETLKRVDYYRGLVVQIGEQLGIAAKTSDDGSIQQDVLCAKVPELVQYERDQDKREAGALRWLDVNVTRVKSIKVVQDISLKRLLWYVYDFEGNTMGFGEHSARSHRERNEGAIRP